MAFTKPIEVNFDPSVAECHAFFDLASKHPILRFHLELPSDKLIESLFQLFSIRIIKMHRYTSFRLHFIPSKYLYQCLNISSEPSLFSLIIFDGLPLISPPSIYKSTK